MIQHELGQTIDVIRNNLQSKNSCTEASDACLATALSVVTKAVSFCAPCGSITVPIVTAFALEPKAFLHTASTGRRLTHPA